MLLPEKIKFTAFYTRSLRFTQIYQELKIVTRSNSFCKFLNRYKFMQDFSELKFDYNL